MTVGRFLPRAKVNSIGARLFGLERRQERRFGSDRELTPGWIDDEVEPLENHLASDQPIYPASINRSIGVPAQAPGGTTRRLALGLSVLPAPDESLPAGPGAIDKGHAYVVTAGRTVNATMMTSTTPGTLTPTAADRTAIACTLNNQGTIVGSAAFQLERRNDATRAVNDRPAPLLTGAIDLSYWH